MAHILQLREYDVPYHLRVCIDLGILQNNGDIQVGFWYTISTEGAVTNIAKVLEKEVRPDPCVLAFDIETTKLPLKFPDSSFDKIMMISYMVDGRGYLIVNREIVAEHIEDFDFIPKVEYESHFTIFNEANERELLIKFFEHFQLLKPAIVVTYNGDSFDWPFIEARAKAYDMDLYSVIGFSRNQMGEYCATYASHMDVYKWVKRDSYLPAGSQGLKAVTKIKLGYNPDEIDPEDMTRFAQERPQILASYSVSDAVATYFLYTKYVHPFIFSLCMIIPLSPDEVLRKGTGTLCETLLMGEAFAANVLMPNKHTSEFGKLHKGHLLDSETYVGGHVEALEPGVFRSDIPTNFEISVSAIQSLINDLDRALTFSLTVEGGLQMDQVVNYEQTREEIRKSLEYFLQNSKLNVEPLIYHLDVGSMYPNIILTNRLQPSSIVNDSVCASCDFNIDASNCQRKMTWQWRGEFFMAKRSEYRMLQNQVQNERHYWNKKLVNYNDLPKSEQDQVLYKRLSDYCRRVYHKIRENEVIMKETTVCMRENSFYVDTVRKFRDRRYDYKNLHKDWKKRFDMAISEGNALKIEESKKMNILYDSLQLAHKCILNSFYGYVMRKGARWYSMDMAGIVCNTGSSIITMARELIEKIGRPLELDTDGIWCILPKGFPQNFNFTLTNGKTYDISYPCVMLNHLVHDKFTNNQYQTLLKDKSYKISSENSIFFEIDGPYRAMILPSSKEEDKLLKKRYAVFNMNGSLAELKGFEIKRRGELKMIKLFQSEIFDTFLHGSNLEECYQSSAKVANHWLDILYSKGVDMEDFQLFDLISENRNMSKSLDEYGAQKSTAISTAKRLAEFLGDQMIKDKGLSCRYIISKKPVGDPVASRAVPVAIFAADEQVKKHFLKKWLKDFSLDNFDIRDILDWDYYIERLESVILKLITIPAAIQKVANPVPRVRNPDWLYKKTQKRNSKIQQTKLNIEALPISIQQNDVADIEDLAKQVASSPIQEPSSVSIDIPDISVDYIGWLNTKKLIWKKKREDKIKSKIMGTFVPKMKKKSDYFQTKSSLLKHHLEILLIEPTKLKGEFKVWALIGATLECLTITVPRIFYVNSRVECNFEELLFQRVYCNLPRSHKAYYLYEVQIPENEFSANLDKYTKFFDHHQVEGIYETQVPPLFRLLTSVGCVATLKSTQQKQSSSYLSTDFILRNCGEYPYLEKARFHYLYFFIGSFAGRNFASIFFSRTNWCHIFILDPSKSDLMDYTKIYKDSLLQEGKLFKNEPFTVDLDLSISTKMYQNEKMFYKAIYQILAEYDDSTSGISVVIAETQESIGLVHERIPILSKFPNINYPFSLNNLGAFQLMDWQKVVAKNIFGRYFQLNNWIHEKLVQARYTHIPMGNLNGDLPILISDIFFSRALKQSNFVLWYSNSEKPDLGGRENDENYFDLNELKMPIINEPGWHSTVCIQIEISFLTLASILSSAALEEAEGVDFFDCSEGLIDNLMEVRDEFIEKESFEESQLSRKVFICLKSLLDGWTKDYLSTGNPLSGKLLSNLFRWLQNHSSGLYDPVLLKKVKMLMHKIFLQLVSKFDKLGCHVINASYSSILINCRKENAEAAESYIRFIIKEIQSSSLFVWLELTPVAYWSNLLWLNTFNFAGFTEEDPYKAKMDWDAVNILPKGLHKVVKVVLSEYLTLCRMPRFEEPGESGRTMIEESDFVGQKDLLSSEFIQKYLGYVREISRTFSGPFETQVDFALKSFPYIPGLQYPLTNAALEFVKLTCHLFSLNKNASQILTLKKHSLKLLGIAEFSDEAQFTLFENSFIISDIVCPVCCFSRNFDLCRDRDLNPKDSSRPRWICSECSYEFPAESMENLVLEKLEKMLISYSLQDLVCQLCRSVRETLLSSKCKCSGVFMTRHKANELKKTLMILQYSSEKLALPLLQSRVSRLIAQSAP